MVITTTHFPIFLFFIALVVVNICAGNGGDCRESERMALLHFKAELIDDFGRLSSWGFSNCCEWKGVVCDNRTNHVVALDLHADVNSELYQHAAAPLRGNIPRSLMNCSGLRVLDLGENEFDGKVPSWLGASMLDLKVLILKSNMFYGSLPSSICHIVDIQVLDVSSNKITGSIPNCVNNFSAMSLLDSFHYYSQHGASPGPGASPIISDSDSAFIIWKRNEATFMNTLPLLKMIDLSGNELTGVIPQEITSLIGLLGLNLSGNNLSGLIPQRIDQIELLNFLDLSRNILSGGIPPTLSQLSHLGVLDLSFNNLSGRIPWDTHMQTFGASAYSGNPGLCGPPLLSRPCPEDVKPTDGGHDSDTIMNRSFYISMLLGFVVAFWVCFWILFFQKWWSVFVMKAYMSVEDWLYVHILVNKRRLMRILGNVCRIEILVL